MLRWRRRAKEAEGETACLSTTATQSEVRRSFVVRWGLGAVAQVPSLVTLWEACGVSYSVSKFIDLFFEYNSSLENCLFSRCGWRVLTERALALSVCNAPFFGGREFVPLLLAAWISSASASKQ